MQKNAEIHSRQWQVQLLSVLSDANGGYVQQPDSEQVLTPKQRAARAAPQAKPPHRKPTNFCGNLQCVSEAAWNLPELSFVSACGG